MDGSAYLQFIAALVFVLCLLGFAAYGLKKYGGFGPGMKPMHKRRIQILEIMPLDMRKKLLLVRHDHQEHLILLGQNSDILITTQPVHAINLEDKDSLDKAV